MKSQQKKESKQTSFSSSEVHTGQHGLDCEECAKYVEDYMSESDNEPDSFELESDELDAQFEDLEADQMIEETKEILKKGKFIKKGDLVVNLASAPAQEKGMTNMMKLSKTK